MASNNTPAVVASTSAPVVPTSAAARAAGPPLSLLESFMCGGLAGCAAVTVCECDCIMKMMRGV